MKYLKNQKYGHHSKNQILNTYLGNWNFEYLGNWNIELRRKRGRVSVLGESPCTLAIMYVGTI